MLARAPARRRRRRPWRGCATSLPRGETSRARSISSSKPWSSTDRPSSASSSFVISYGKPKVSWSRKASSAETQEVWSAFARSITSASRRSPCSSVRLKLSSSAFAQRSMVGHSPTMFG